MKWLAVLTASALALTAALPWLGSSGPARRWLLATANRTLAPARLEAKTIRLSWFGSLGATGLALRDGSGQTVLAANGVALDRGLIALALRRPIAGVLTVTGADVDLERRADGSINLTDALAPLFRPSKAPAVAAPPSTPGVGPDLVLKVVSGRLRVRAPELPEPFEAGTLEGKVHLPSTGPLTFRVALGEPATGVDATLEASGEYDLQRSDLSATLIGKDWPWSVATSGVVARGRYDGTLVAKRDAGLWGVSGVARVLGLDATGPALAADRLQFDALEVRCDVSQQGEGWDVRQLDLTTPVGAVKAGGTFALSAKPGESIAVSGQVDLAALARQLPHLLRVRDGLTLQGGSAHWDVRLNDGPAAEGRRYAVEARVSDLVAREGSRTIAVRDPATLSALVVQRPDGFRVDRLSVKSAFLNVSGSGDLEKGVTLSATLDLAALERELHDLIDFGGVELAGQGRLAADYRRGPNGTFAARFAAELRAGSVKGLTAAPLARNLVHIDAAASGPVAANGLPTDLGQAKLGVKSDDLDAGSRLARDPATHAVRITDLHLTLQPPPNPPAPPAETIRLALNGSFDPATGTLELSGPAGAAPEPIALGAGGLKLAGLGLGGDLGGTADLALNLGKLDRAWAAFTGGAPHEVGGTATLQCGIGLKADGALTLGAGASSPEITLARTDPPGRRSLGPIALGLNAHRIGGTDTIDLEKVVVACQYGTVNVAGRLADPSGRRLADLHGTIAPNWNAVDVVLAESLEPGARMRGEVRPFRLRGPLSGPTAGAIVQGLDAELAIDKFEALAYGMHLAPTPVVVRCADHRMTIDPIDTTINNGRTHLLPEVAIDGQGAIALRLADGTAIEGAEINDDVSRKLLAFVAPVLHDASKVTGKLSAHLSRAEFPIIGNEQARMTLLGKIDFNDVAFSAGSFANTLVGLTGKKDATLRLQQPIELAIANGRVTQKGLSIPINPNAKLELDGSVGFDRTLAMRARVPLTRKMVGNQGGFDDVLEGLRVGVPIGGTLARPTIDDRAFRSAARDAAKQILKRGAADFLKELVKPEAAAPRAPLR